MTNRRVTIFHGSDGDNRGEVGGMNFDDDLMTFASNHRDSSYIPYFGGAED